MRITRRKNEGPELLLLYDYAASYVKKERILIHKCLRFADFGVDLVFRSGRRGVSAWQIVRVYSDDAKTGTCGSPKTKGMRSKSVSHYHCLQIKLKKLRLGKSIDFKTWGVTANRHRPGLNGGALSQVRECGIDIAILSAKEEVAIGRRLPESRQQFFFLRLQYL